MSDLAHIDNTTNKQGGLHDTFYFAPLSWFDLIAKPNSNAVPFSPTNNPVTIYANHVFKTCYGFLKATASHNANLFKMIAQGQVGSKSFNKEFQCFLPGDDPILHEVMAHMLNDQFIVLAKSANCDNGLVHQIGNTCLPARITNMEFSTGTVDGAERKGYQCALSASAGSVTLYAGAIPLYVKQPANMVASINLTKPDLAPNEQTTGTIVISNNGCSTSAGMILCTHAATVGTIAYGTLPAGVTENNPGIFQTNNPIPVGGAIEIPFTFTAQSNTGVGGMSLDVVVGSGGETDGSDNNVTQAITIA